MKKYCYRACEPNSRYEIEILKIKLRQTEVRVREETKEEYKKIIKNIFKKIECMVDDYRVNGKIILDFTNIEYKNEKNNYYEMKNNFLVKSEVQKE